MTKEVEAIDPALVARMVALIRGMGDAYLCAVTPMDLPTRQFDMRHYGEARDIARLLPKPIDPDLIEAREVARKCLDTREQSFGFLDGIARGKRDEYSEVRIALAAIKRGRELAQVSA